MAVPVGGKVVLDTSIFVNFLRLGLHSEWVLGATSGRIRFLSSIVLMELSLGADTRRRRRAVDRVRWAFPATRQVSPSPASFDRAGRLFRLLYGKPSGDRLGRMNDLLIALSAREIGAAVVTRNREEFGRIASALPALTLIFP